MMYLPDWPVPAPVLIIGREVVKRIDRFTYLSSFVSLDRLVYDESSAWVQKVCLVFAILCHLWRRRDIRLPTNGVVYCAAVRSALLYGYRVWPVNAVFDVSTSL